MRYFWITFFSVMTACSMAPKKEAAFARPFGEPQWVLPGEKNFAFEESTFKVPQSGMSKRQIRLWMGEPEEVFITGKASFQNEKWIYSDFLRNTIPYRTLYFENGFISYWE
jgi:hypothetical protein